MDISDVERFKLKKNQDDEKLLLKKIHENYKKENVMYNINTQKQKLKLYKVQKRKAKLTKIKNAVLVSIAILILLGIALVLKNIDDRYMNDCTQHASESFCRGGV